MTRINLTDDKETIFRKIRKAKTDTQLGISYDLVNRREISNLVNIYSMLSSQSIEQVCSQFANANNVEFKEALSSIVADKIVPIGEEMKRLSKDPAYVDNILDRGATAAKEKAFSHMKEIKKIVGYL